jgi:glyoxylase-like metal-dependent hydrolase (beta-lactamase superfamily II)
VTDTVARPSPTSRPPKQEQQPASENVTEVAAGVLRMQLPIRMPGLGHVNTYAFIDGRGIALMDPGLPGPESFDALVSRMSSVGLSTADVHTVYVTHSHIDHFGLAPRLAQESRHTLELMTHEAFAAHWRRSAGEDLVLLDVDLDDVDESNPFEGETPWGRMWGPPPGTERIQFERPHPTRYVRDGEPIRLAGREMFIVHSPGHTLDHICLSDPETGVLFSGDHVLPSITPHISGLGSGRDPLDLFEESLVKVGGMDGVRLVLPAHGHPFTDLRGRTEAIRTHHHERLLKLRDLSQELGPATVEEFSHHLFRRDHWGPMAEAEAFAHLEHLRLAGLAERRGAGRQMVYELAPPTRSVL